MIRMAVTTDSVLVYPPPPPLLLREEDSSFSVSECVLLEKRQTVTADARLCGFICSLSERMSVGAGVIVVDG